MVYNIGKALLERLHFGAFVVFVGATEAFPLPGVILLFDLSGAEITDVILSRDDVVIRKHFHPSLWLRLASPRSSFR